MLRTTAIVPNFDKMIDGSERQIAGYLTEAMRDASGGLKEELRAQVVSAGLGARLANTWRGTTYPETGASLDPAAYVWSNAPAIVTSFATGATILPLGGKKYLWIPTKDVPRGRGRGRGRATPPEVELMFNQEFTFLKGKRGHLLAFVNVIQAKNRRGYRSATKGRVAAGRAVRLVLMFTLVATVRMPKKLDLDAAANAWGGRFQSLLEARWR